MKDVYAVLRPLLFRLEPERAHHLALKLAGLAASPTVARFLRSVVFAQPSPELRSTILGYSVRSPIWIAAGLDKDCSAVEALAATGVGAIELGTVTPLPQPGNESPRMFRFAGARGLVNRLGFPSIGVAAFVERLKRVNRTEGCLLGVNIGKNKDTPLETCERDYNIAAAAVGQLSDYLVINVSSPNTPGLRGLQTPEMLTRVIVATQSANRYGRPLAVKLSPDCSEAQLSEIVGCCLENGINAVIVSNTTVSRPESCPTSEVGGLSGRPLRPIAQQALEHVLAARLRKGAGKNISIIGCGGIETAEQAFDHLNRGCAAVQLYTALVYEGPGLISRLNKELISLKKSAYTSRPASFDPH